MGHELRPQILPILALLALLSAAPIATAGVPAPEPIELPGAKLGKARSSWIAPWVSQEILRMGDRWSGKVRWHDRSGEVVREHLGVLSISGHVGGGPSVYLAINGDWRVVLEHWPGHDGFVDGTRDSRTLIHQYHPSEGVVAVEVYVKGVLAGTVGPYPRHPFEDVRLGADGSLALPVSDPPRVVVARPDGKVRFVAPTALPAGTHATYHPAPGGAGVLVETEGEEPGQSAFEYLTAKGRASRLLILPNPHVMAWAPDRATALVRTSAHETRWLLVDFAAGKVLWDVPDPGLVNVPAVDVGERYAILAGLAHKKLGDLEGPVRCLYALDLEGGSVAARWLPVPCCRFSTEPGSFLRLGEKLYLLTGAEFCEVRARDIDTRKHGWRSLAPRFGEKDRRAFFKKVSGVLTQDDWHVVFAAHESVPDGWLTLDGGGYLLDNQFGAPAFRVWVLPEDWIGIRAPGERVRESVLAGDGVKVIVQSESDEVHTALWRQWATSASLVNGGWREAERIFEGREAEVEGRVAKLVSAYARDPAERDAAALSLVELGVPARSVIGACAAGGGGQARKFCVSALGWMGGEESVRILADVVNGRDEPHGVVKYAAMSLGRISDPGAGAALLQAVGAVEDEEALGQIALSLGRIRHRAAAPALLARLEGEAPDWLAAHFAKALADLGATDAVPAIRKLCGEMRFTAAWALRLWKDAYLGDEPSIALLRLTGEWGEPAGGVRALLLPPQTIEAGEPKELALVLENVGDVDRFVTESLFEGKLVVNGTAHDVGPQMWDGNASLLVNDVWVWEVDLAGIVTEPGVYRMRYELGKLRSPELVLTVK